MLTWKYQYHSLCYWLLEVVIGYHIEVNLAVSVSVPLVVLLLQYEPPETLEAANICMVMASFLLMKELLVAFSYKFQEIPSLMALTLSDDTNSHSFRNVFSWTLFWWLICLYQTTGSQFL